MRVRVDDERCEGHGRCYALAPELFEPDDIGNSHEIGGATPWGAMSCGGRNSLTTTLREVNRSVSYAIAEMSSCRVGSHTPP